MYFYRENKQVLIVRKEGRKDRREGRREGKREGEGGRGGGRTFSKRLPWLLFMAELIHILSCIIISINQLPWDRSQCRDRKLPCALRASVYEI